MSVRNALDVMTWSSAHTWARLSYLHCLLRVCDGCAALHILTPSTLDSVMNYLLVHMDCVDCPAHVKAPYSSIDCMVLCNMLMQCQHLGAPCESFQPWFLEDFSSSAVINNAAAFAQLRLPY